MQNFQGKKVKVENSKNWCQCSKRIMSPLFSSIPSRAPPAQVLTSYRFPSTGPVKLSHEILNIWGLWALQRLYGFFIFSLTTLMGRVQMPEAFVIDPLTPKTFISQATTRGNACEDKTVQNAKERKEERTRTRAWQRAE